MPQDQSDSPSAALAAPGTVLRYAGFCPICEEPGIFSAKDAWFRDHLVCEACKSLPRERALATVLNDMFPFWRDFAIHEASPVPRGISLKMARECKSYVETQFFPGKPLGSVVSGFRNEDLERQTFPDEVFDLVVSLDVMEHVNDPGACFREIWRTLKPGGAYLFTAPTFKEKTASERRARYRADGTVEYLAEPEYHGSAASDEGALVTFHYGYDLPELIARWSRFDTRVVRFHDRRRGILGELTEVYLCEK